MTRWNQDSIVKVRKIFMSKVASTREIIEKLQAYEKINGIGAVIGLATVANRDRTVEYKFEIVNDSDYNRVFNNEDNHYKETVIEISSIEDKDLFQ